MTDSGTTPKERERPRCKPALLGVACLAFLLAAACSRQSSLGAGSSQVPVVEPSLEAGGHAGDELGWQVSFINSRPLTYRQHTANTFLVDRDFTAEMTFSTSIDQELFERTLQRGFRDAGGDPVLTWENGRSILFDVRGCEGRAHIDLSAIARKAGLKDASPLEIYCGPPHDVLRWNPDRGSAIVGSVTANLTPAMENAGDSALFHHMMSSSGDGADVGVWVADFSERTVRPLTVHYLGAKLETSFMEDDSLIISTGGDDLQLFGGDGLRVRQFDPEDIDLIVGLEVDNSRGRVAVFEGRKDNSGRSGTTRLRLLDRNLDEITTVEECGRLSRLSGKWRTVDAVWLDADTIAFVHWNNRFFGVVAIADVSTGNITQTEIIADELSGVLADGRFVVRRQAGGRAGCWRAEAPDGGDVTPLCERLPGPVRAEVSPDGSLVALELPGATEIDVWNRVTGERRRIGTGVIGGWTRSGELVWISERETFTREAGAFH